MLSLCSQSRWLFLAIFPFLLSGCSWFNWLSSDSESQRGKISASHWEFRDSWVADSSLPDSVYSSPEPLQIRGECRFGPEVLDVFAQKNKKGLLVPLLKAGGDKTLAPDLESSAKLYKSLNNHLNLTGAGDSLHFFQTLLAGIEHACPEHATREIDNCSLKDFLSMGGLLGSRKLYDWNRISKWQENHDRTGYLVVSTADLLNSSAMLHARYSPYGRVLTNADKNRRNADIKPYVGALRLDWVLTDYAQEQRFRSRGYCALGLPNAYHNLATDQLQSLHDALLPDFISFVEKALAQLPMTK